MIYKKESMNNNQTGALNEVKAQVWFMENGFDVFTPTHSATRSDFIAVKGSNVSRVQVKTAQYNGPYIQSRLDIRGSRYTSEDTDLLFFILDKRMWLVPISEVEGKPSVCLGKVDDESYVAKVDYSQYEINTESN